MARQNKKFGSEPRDVMPVEPMNTEFMPADVMPEDVSKPVRTVNGKPIPEHLEHLVLYEHTDQGRAELAARPNVRKDGPRVEFMSEPWDKMLEQRMDQPWMAADPLGEAIDRHRETGFTYRGLAPEVINRQGMRGWEPVRDAKGNEVKVSSLILGKMPVEYAHKRNEFFRERGNNELRMAEENYAVEQEKAIRDAGGRGISPLRRGDLLTDARDPERAASIGFEQTRGQQ